MKTTVIVEMDDMLSKALEGLDKESNPEFAKRKSDNDDKGSSKKKMVKTVATDEPKEEEKVVVEDKPNEEDNQPQQEQESEPEGWRCAYEPFGYARPSCGYRQPWCNSGYNNYGGGRGCRGERGGCSNKHMRESRCNSNQPKTLPLAWTCNPVFLPK